MSVAGIATIAARIASIEQRFEAGAGFAALEVATGLPSRAPNPGGVGVVPAGGTNSTHPGATWSDRVEFVNFGATNSTHAGYGGVAAGSTPGRMPGWMPGWTAGWTADWAAGSAPDWAARLPEAGRPWTGAIEAAAEQAGIDPRLLASLVWAESGFQSRASSGAGAIGLTQLMPGTARALGVDPADPVQNLQGGARYLRQQLDRFGSAELALAAYNAGPGRVAQAGGVPRIPETQVYVARVLGHYERLRSGS
jgi:hypothetical protein